MNRFGYGLLVDLSQGHYLRRADSGLLALMWPPIRRMQGAYGWDNGFTTALPCHDSCAPLLLLLLSYWLGLRRRLTTSTPTLKTFASLCVRRTLSSGRHPDRAHPSGPICRKNFRYQRPSTEHSGRCSSSLLRRVAAVCTEPPLYHRKHLYSWP